MFGFDISHNPVQPIKRTMDEPLAIVDTDNPPDPGTGNPVEDDVPIYPPEDTDWTVDDVLINAKLSEEAKTNWIANLPEDQKTGLYIVAGIIAYNIFLK